MRTSRWTPSIVPEWADQTVYLVENDFGRLGRAFVETDREYADLEATITALLEGQYSHPVRIVASTRRSVGRRTFPRTLLTNYAADATCNCAMYPQLFKTSSKGMRVIIASWPCGWCEPCPSSAKSRRQSAPKVAYPGFIEPALATSIEKVPGGERWLHEIKFDGYRVQVHVVNEAVKVFTRRGHDWTKRFRKIADDAWHVAARSAIIDGEVVVPAADGSTDFSVLQNELKGQSTKIALVAFDLLYLNGHDLRKLPLVERKAQLKKTSSTPISNSARALKSMALRYLLTPVRSGSRAWSPRSVTAATFPAAATTG